MGAVLVPVACIRSAASGMVLAAVCLHYFDFNVGRASFSFVVLHCVMNTQYAECMSTSFQALNLLTIQICSTQPLLLLNLLVLPVAYMQSCYI